MLHFAFCVLKKNLFLDFILFLITSTFSSVILGYSYYNYIIKGEKTSNSSMIFGKVSFFLIMMAIPVNFLCVIFSFKHYKEIYFSRFGAKSILHKLFSWIHINHSIIKLDFCLMLIFLLSVYVFQYELIYYLVTDSLIAVFLFLNIFFMQSALKNEKKICGYSFMSR